MADEAPVFDPFANVFNQAYPGYVAAPEKEKGVRGRDRKKQEIEWVDVQRVYEWEDGWYVGWLTHPDDQATLGRLMGHCSGTHFVWTCEEKIWYFLAVFDPDDVPRSTLHAKQATWMNKKHPRDSAPPIPVPISASRGGYITHADVLRCFKEAGEEYEPGKYHAPYYNSTTYDIRNAGVNDSADSFSRIYGPAVRIQNKPVNVDQEIWDAYTKAGKAVEDNFNKNSNAVQVRGRRFKFDGKWLILLSASNKSQGGSQGDVGKKIVEWLNSTGKKKKGAK